MKTKREKELEDILVQVMRPMQGIPFEIVIRALFNKSVEKFDQDDSDNKTTLESIVGATIDACKVVQKTPIDRPRPNEVGNDMEKFLINGLKSQGLRADVPKTQSGASKVVAYPDIIIEREDSLPVYVEVKTYAEQTDDSSMRSFFVSHSEDPKVIYDAHHIAVGFEMVREGNNFWPVAYKIVDLYGLKCDMKAEFNSSNKELYCHDRILIQGSVPCKEHEAT